MRKITVIENVTLDGVMQAPGRSDGPGHGRGGRSVARKADLSRLPPGMAAPYGQPVHRVLERFGQRSPGAPPRPRLMVFAEVLSGGCFTASPLGLPRRLDLR